MVVNTRRKYKGGRYTRKIRGGADRPPESPNPRLERSLSGPASANFAAQAAASGDPGRLERGKTVQPDARLTDRLSKKQERELEHLYNIFQASEEKLNDILETKKRGETINEVIARGIDLCSLMSLWELIKRLGPIATGYVSQLPVKGTIHTAIQIIMSYMSVDSTPMAFAKSVVDLLSLLPTYALVATFTSLTILFLAKKGKLSKYIDGSIISAATKAEEVKTNLGRAAGRFKKSVETSKLVIAKGTLTAIDVAANPETAPQLVLSNTLTILEEIVNKIPGNQATKTYVQEVIEVLTSDEKLANALEISAVRSKKDMAKALADNADEGMTAAQAEYFSGLRSACPSARRLQDSLYKGLRRAAGSAPTVAYQAIESARKEAGNARKKVELFGRKVEKERREREEERRLMQQKVAMYQGALGAAKTRASAAALGEKNPRKTAAAKYAAAAVDTKSDDEDYNRGAYQQVPLKRPLEHHEVQLPSAAAARLEAVAAAGFKRKKIVGEPDGPDGPPGKKRKGKGPAAASPKGQSNPGGGGRKTRKRRKGRKSRRRKSRRKNSRKGGYKYKKKKSSRRRN